MSGQDSDVESLLRRSSPRREPPADMRRRVLTAVEREWAQHKRRRWRLPVAMAATLLMAVVAGLVVTTPAQRVVLQVSHNGGLWIDGVLQPAYATALDLEAGTILEADTSSRLVTPLGAEVRLRGGTRLTWLAPQAVELENGSLYVHTGGRDRLRVETPLGVVTDVGTTFMVTVQDGLMEVAMREGVARVDTAHGHYTARMRDGSGDVVRVGSDRINARPEPSSAGRWEWIHEVHPGYLRREVLPLLMDIADDMGLSLEFADPEVRTVALESRLEGSLEGLKPAQALEVVLATSGLRRLDSDAGALLVAFQSGDE